VQELAERAQVAKEWARYCMRKHRQDMKQKVVRYQLRHSPEDTPTIPAAGAAS